LYPTGSTVQLNCSSDLQRSFEAEAYRSESSMWFNRSACSGTVLEVKMAAFENTDVSIYGTSQHDRPEVSDLVNLVPQWERRSRHFETASELG
jgi:hypothetical protein